MKTYVVLAAENDWRGIVACWDGKELVYAFNNSSNRAAVSRQGSAYVMRTRWKRDIANLPYITTVNVSSSEKRVKLPKVSNA